MTLQQWLDAAPSSNTFHAPSAAKTINGAVYIPDVRTIDHVRTYLWDLEDYRVSSVTGGSIVLIPKD